MVSHMRVAVQGGMVRQILGKVARAPSNGARQIWSGVRAPVKFGAVDGPLSVLCLSAYTPCLSAYTPVHVCSMRLTNPPPPSPDAQLRIA